MDADAIVVGGGLAGLVAATELIEAGALAVERAARVLAARVAAVHAALAAGGA